MNDMGTIAKTSVLGAGTGAVVGFMAGGPTGAVTGAKFGATVGAKTGLLIKTENGVDSAGRQIQQIATQTTEKMNESIGKNIDQVGAVVTNATIKATDRLCDMAAKTLEALVNNWSGIVVSGYVLSAFLYATRETSDIYFKHCKGQEKDINCVVMSLANLSVHLAIIGTTGFIFHQMFKHRQ